MALIPVTANSLLVKNLAIESERVALFWNEPCNKILWIKNLNQELWRKQG